MKLSMGEYFKASRKDIFKSRIQQREQAMSSLVSTQQQTADDSIRLFDDTNLYQNLNISSLIDVKINMAKKADPNLRNSLVKPRSLSLRNESGLRMKSQL